MTTKGLLDEKILKTQGFSFLHEFLADIVTVFPEYREKLVEHYNPFLSRNQERIQGDNQDKCDILIEFLQNIAKYNKLISEKDESLFDKNIYLLKEVNFKKLWNSKISDTTREKLWNYLQTFSMLSITINSNNELKHIMGSLNSIVKGEDTGDASKDPQMNAVLNNLKKLTTSLSKEDDKDPEVPGIPKEEVNKVEDNLNTMFNGSKIGDLAKEIAGDLNVENMIKESSGNPENLLKSLFQGNSGEGDNKFNIMNVVENISSKINKKITDGELKEDDLMNEAKNMMSSMQGNSLFGNLFNQTASAMETSGKGGMPDISKMADMLKMVGGDGGGSDEAQLDEIFSDKPTPKRSSEIPSGDRNAQARQRLQRKLQQRKDKQ